MITRKPARILTSSIAALAAIASFSPSSSDAAGGSWNVDAAGNWGTAGNWSPAAIPGTAAGDVINLQNALTVARTVTIDTTSRTAGDLNIGSTAAFGFTLASSAGTVVLNLDGTGTNDATVDFTANANTISAPLTLVDNAVFRSNLAAAQTLSGVISGAKTVTFNNDTNGTVNAATSGAGQFVVTGNNTFSLGTTISDVRVNITTNNTALGTGAVTIQSGGQVFTSTALTNVANTFNIAGDGWAEATAGSPLGALRVEGGATITGNVAMTANAAVGGNSTATNTISGVVSGAFVLSKRGTGNITLSGNNTYSGGTAINNGSLILANNNAAGTGAITINTGGATNPTRLYVSGGITVPNAVTVAGNTFGVAGNGVLQQTGTGQGRINGAITINGSPTAGGHFVGGTATGNELVLGGAITSSVASLTHRDGRVIYAGGGTGGSWIGLSITGTALVGAANGIPTAVTTTIGASGTGTLDLNGFDQTLAAAVFGTAGASTTTFSGNILLGAKTLTLNGDVSSQLAATLTNVTHTITASAGGTLAFGSSPRNINIADNTSALEDMRISGATITGTGGLTKLGAGSLSLSGVTITAPLTVSAGAVRTGTVSSTGSITANNLTFGNGTTLFMKTGVGGDLITAPNFVNSGTTNLVVGQLGGALANGTYNLINYAGGTSPGTSGFSLAPIGHATASLVDTGTAIALSVIGNDQVIWDGTNSSAWATGATGNWKLGSTLAQTDYIESDDVVFQDGPANATASIAANVTPSNVSFTNSTSTAITISGAAGIIGTTALMKTGNGVLNLGGVHQYVGATTLSAGTTNLTGSISGTNVTVGAGASLVHSGTIANGNISIASGATLTSTGTISGSGGLTTSGSTTLRGANTYTGATSILAGTTELDHDGGTLTATSGVSVASGATLLLTRDGTATATTTTFSRNLTGSGNLDANIRTAAGTTAADSLVLSGNNAGFSGPIRLLAPAQGTYRLSLTAPTQAGTGTIEVQNGAQIFVSGTAATYTNNISITGTGFVDSAGNIGALRLDGGNIWAGNINVIGSARIGSHNSTGTISGSISGGNLEFGATNFNNSYTTILTGANSYGTTTIGGQNTQTGGVPSMRLNVGAGGTTGTLGAGSVVINGDGANGILGFDRSDGYTLAAGQTITGAVGAGTIANSIQRTFVDFDTLGTGFDNAGNAITLGTSTLGGQLRFGQARANTITNLTGNITSQIFRVGSNAPGATVNLNNTANVNVTTLDIGIGAATNSANTLNINNGASVTATQLMAGQVANGIGVINQAAGSAVNVETQLRLGHFPTNTSVYNMAGGTLTVGGATANGQSPTLTPSTAAGGGASATGDNNINALATATVLGGGIYLGNDGTGVMNHTGGTITTNWIVLDNRGATGAGANMADGIDRYNISGSAALNLRSNWGLIGRNDGSYAVGFGGGTVRVDNTGTGTGTGANITIPLDAIIDTVAATTTTLDTNGAGNGFTLTKNVTGTGTLALAGGGNINLNSSLAGAPSVVGAQTIAASLSGTNPLIKSGAQTTTLSGASTGYTGPITVSAGRLNADGALGATSSITVADGAALGGETTVGSLTLGSTTGSTLFFNPNTPAKLTAATATFNGTTTLDFSAPIPGDGTYPALSFTSSSGAGTFVLAGASNYRSATVNQSATAVDVVIGGTKSLIWNGTGGSTWDTKVTSNWEDSGSPGTQDVFYSADVVNFGDTDANGNPITPPTGVTVTAGVSPAVVTVSGTTNNYTLTSTGAGIAAGYIDKSGSTTLTLVGANTYPGPTQVSAGTVSVADPASLGSGVAGNTISLSGGGALAYTGAVAANLGANRNIAVGFGGGVISHRNATAATITIPGNLSGTGALALNSTLAGGGTFLLSGSNNSAYTGAITVDAFGTGLSTLNFASQASVPKASSITLNYPAAGATGNATTLSLNGVSTPVETTLNMTSFLNGTISLRSQVTNTGTSSIGGPITVSGTAIVQMSITNGTLTLNGPVTAGGGGFNSASSVFFLRGAGGNGVVNGTITLPGAQLSKTDANSWTINSTGNDWLTTGVLVGTLRTGATGVLPSSSNLVLGQNDANTAVLALDGFSQTVGSLASNPTTVGANTTGKSITSSTAATLTVNQSVDTTYASLFTGSASLVKAGAGSLTLSGASTTTGNIAVNGGTLVATALGAANGASGSLGASNVAGKTVTVGSTGTLSFTSNNIFGNGVGNANLPAVAVNGGTLTSTRYNVLGPVSLSGATLTQSSTDSGAYEGFQFRGDVTVGGVAASSIATGNGAANHLNANTTFTVADATGSAASDLVVSAPLRNQSGDFASAVGGLTKAGPGTMELSALNSYTGATLVSGGVLKVSGSISGSTVTVDGATSVLMGSGGTVGATTLTNGASISPGASPGILTVAGNFTMNSGTNFLGEVNGTTVGTGYDQLVVNGTVSLGNATLSLSGSYTGTSDLFTLILNDGTGDAVSGTFAGLSEGASVFATGSGQEFTISYVGGDGNDVVLAAVPEPGAAAMLLGGVGMLLGLQRRRRKV